MRTARRLLGCGMILVVVSTAIWAADEAPSGDLAKLQGNWSSKVGPDKSIPLVLSIRGDKVTLTITRAGGEDTTLKGRVRVDQTKRPKEIDWFEFDRPDGQPLEDNLGIYELDSDSGLRICGGGPGNERPEKFQEGADGDHPRITVWKRVAEKSAKGAN